MTKGSANNSAGTLTFTLSSLAERIGARLEGDGLVTICGAASLSDAGPGDISFLSDKRYRSELESTRASAVIVPAKLRVTGRNFLRAENPYLAFARVLELFFPPRETAPGCHPTAVVAEDSFVDETAVISAYCCVESGAQVGPFSVLHPFCYLGPSSEIGEHATLHPGVTVLGGVSIGDRSVIHSGTVIGSDGFGYVFDGSEHRKIPQVGTVEIGSDVEIGANVTIDRATVGVTRIGDGTKIDNLVQIAHNVEVGSQAVIVSQTGIAGSTRIGVRAVLGGQVAVAGHLSIGDGARIGARSGILHDVPAGETMSGIGPLPHRDWLRAQSSFDKLPELRRRVQLLEKKLSELENGGPQKKT